LKTWKYFLVLILGVIFGWVLSESQVISLYQVRRMFAFQDTHMFLTIAAAVATGAIFHLLLNRSRTKDISGEQVEWRPYPIQTGNVAGGLIFGVGWYITGACPGPVYVLIGQLQWPALIIVGAAIAGNFIFLVTVGKAIARSKKKEGLPVSVV